MGEFLLYFILAIICSIPLSYILVFWFKKAIEARINSSVQLDVKEVNKVLIKNENSFPGFDTIPLLEARKIDFKPMLPITLAILLTSVSINFTRVYFEQEFRLVQFLLVQYALCLPLFYFYFVEYGHLLRFRKRLLLISFCSFFLVVSIASLISNQSFYLLVFTFWYLFAFNTAAVVFVQLFRYIKGIVFALLPGLFVGLMLLFTSFKLFGSNDTALKFFFDPIYDTLKLMKFEHGTYGFFFLILFLFFILISLVLTGVVKYLYKRKLLNARILVFDIIWFFQIVSMVSGFREIKSTALMIIAFFLFYKVIFIMAHKLFYKVPPKRTLLVLRVFSLGKKSDWLFNKVKNWWQFQGPIKLIAGYDLTTSLIDVNDLLAFVSGKMKNRFCTSLKLIQQNVQKIDYVPDIDGRFRVNEMYCTNTTWKLVLDELIQDISIVIMDLRSFSKTNAGCTHEIQALVREVAFSKILFVVDSNTDKNFFQECIMDAWQELPAGSPNWQTNSGKIKLFNYEREHDFEMLVNSIY